MREVLEEHKAWLFYIAFIKYINPLTTEPAKTGQYEIGGFS
jgi:hypothetical protein